MKRKVEELRENLDEFVEQTDYPVLVVGCLSDELAYVVKFLQSLEEKHKEGYFVIFPQTFASPSGYLDGIVESIRTQVTAAQPMRAERGEAPFPPIPPELADVHRPAEERLLGVLHYLRSLLPNEEDHYVVVGLLPLQCRDYEGYCRLVASIMPVPDVKPWMVPLRIVAYDNRAERRLLDAMAAQKLDKVLTFEVDFSTPALTDSLTRDVADPSLPVAERMGCLTQLAALDYSYQRYNDAVEKYGVLYKYYEAQKIPSMQAICLLGTGDTLRAAGQPAAAKEIMQRGLATALEAKALPVMINLFLSIVDVCVELNQHGEAESYADSGTKVAAGALSPLAYADLHEKKGDAQIAQGKFADGMATYNRCKELCKMYEYHHRWKAVLEKEIKLYQDAGMDAEKRNAEQQLAVIEELERRGGSRAVREQSAAAAPPPVEAAHSGSNGLTTS
jgi:tetratricopeptide (TPR) repeat protein